MTKILVSLDILSILYIWTAFMKSIAGVVVFLYERIHLAFSILASMDLYFQNLQSFADHFNFRINVISSAVL